MISLVLSSTALSTFSIILSGKLLHLLLRSSRSSSLDVPALLHLLERIHGIPADIAEGYLCIDRLFLYILGNFLSASSVISGNTRRIQFPSLVGLMPSSDVRIAFSMGLIRALLPWLNHNHSGFRNGNIANLLEGRGVP